MLRKKIIAFLLMFFVVSNIVFANGALAGEYRIMFVPNDEYYRDQPYFDMIEAEEAWEETQGSSEVVIAVIDTGVDLKHPDLKPNLVQGWNFVKNNANPQDDNGHGTHVAGVAAAVIDNGTGVAGLAGKAGIMPIKVLDAEGEGDEDDIASGIRYAVENGAKIINLSLGTSKYSKTIEEAVYYAYDQGALLIGAAGNDDGGPVAYPAKFANVMAVSAIDDEGKLAKFSNYGPEIEIAAPGTSLLNTWWQARGSDYAYLDGTSAAAPLVSGLAALIWSKYPYLYNFQVRQLIKDTADDLGAEGFDEVYGYGKINALKALTSYAPKTFKDIQNHWAQAEIEELATNGIVKGRETDYFEPQATITRAEFAVLLIRALEIEREEKFSGSKRFTDVLEAEWYYPSVEMATQKGLVNGFSNGTFQPLSQITRQQMAVMISRALELKGIEANLELEELAQILTGYSDIKTLAPWSQQDFIKLLYLGIFKGTTENTLNPSGPASRAEAVTILKRTLDIIPAFT